MKDEFDYELRYPIKLAEGKGEIKRLILSSPKKSTKKYIFKFKKHVQIGISDMQTKFANQSGADTNEHHDVESKSTIDDNQYVELARMSVYSESCDIDACIDLFEKIILCSGICQLDNGNNIDKVVLDELEPVDIEEVMLMYIANFILKSQIQRNA